MFGDTRTQEDLAHVRTDSPAHSLERRRLPLVVRRPQRHRIRNRRPTSGSEPGRLFGHHQRRGEGARPRWQRREIRGRYDDSLLGADIAPGAISTSEVINGTLGAADLASNSVGYAEIAPDAFNTEIVDTGFFYGIADNSIQSNEVSDNSLSGDDIAESTLAPSLDGVSAASSDTAFGPTITSRDIDSPTNLLSDNLDAGTWVVLGEVGIFNNGDDATSVECGIWTDNTRREFVSEGVEAILDDSGDMVNVPMTAAFSTSSPTTLKLSCINGHFGDDGVLRPISADLVAIPVATLG